MCCTCSFIEQYRTNLFLGRSCSKNALTIVVKLSVLDICSGPGYTCLVASTSFQQLWISRTHILLVFPKNYYHFGSGYLIKVKFFRGNASPQIFDRVLNILLMEKELYHFRLCDEISYHELSWVISTKAIMICYYHDILIRNSK